MRSSRLYTEALLEPEHSVTVHGKRVHYLQRVLRMSAGDSVVLFNGDGWDYLASILSLTRDSARFEVAARLPAVAESPLSIRLVQAISRGERMDTSLQKATELGVRDIQPLLSERVEVKLSGARLEKRMLHWRGVIASACEQSGRATLPEIHEPRALSDWVGSGCAAGQCRVLQPGASRGLLHGLVPSAPVILVVGPEGGFADSELHMLQAAGAEPAHLGPRVLRTETAGPAAIAAIQARLGDMV